MKTSWVFITEKYITRAAIITFWVVLLALFLFFPLFMQLVRPANSINVFTFPRVIDAQQLSAFEQETGIKVYLSYYENNDELLVKMRQTKGEGYDLIIPSDYALDLLRREGLLQKIDHSKLLFTDNIHPRLKGHYYDPQGEYSIPYFWGLYGIGFDRHYFNTGTTPTSWQDVFEPNDLGYKIGMLNNAREAVFLAALYLFGSVDELDDAKLLRIKELLIRQKKWVQTYTDLGPDYLLLSGSCPLVVSMSSEIWQAHKQNSSIDFVVPAQGTFMVIDAVALSLGTKKNEQVYALLNYLYKPEVMVHQVQRFALAPAQLVGPLANTSARRAFDILHELPAIHFFKNTIPEHTLQTLWLALKSS